MKKTNVILSLLMFFGAIGFAQTNYQILNKIQLEGNGGWDYLTVDEGSSRLFVSHATVTQVVDLTKNTLLATIPDTKGVHGIALASVLNKGFISNGRDTSVTVIDLKTLKTIDKIKVTGNNPDAILFDPFSTKVFTFNGRSSNSTVIDAKTDKVLATIPLMGKPEFSVTDLKGYIYVNIEDKSSICKINTTTLKVEQTWSIAPGEEPSGLAIDLKNHRLFSVCSNKLMIVINSDNGKVVSSLKIGENVDGVSFDPVLNRIYSSNGDGTLTVIQEKDANTFSVLENFPTQKGARTISINTKNHRVYLPTAEYGEAPAATANNPRPRASLKPNSFTILEIAPK